MHSKLMLNRIERINLKRWESAEKRHECSTCVYIYKSMNSSTCHECHALVARPNWRNRYTRTGNASFSTYENE